MIEYSTLKHPVQFSLLVLRKVCLMNSDSVHCPPSSTGRFLRSDSGMVSHPQPPWWGQGWEWAEGRQIPPSTVSRATARHVHLSVHWGDRGGEKMGPCIEITWFCGLEVWNVWSLLGCWMVLSMTALCRVLSLCCTLPKCWEIIFLLGIVTLCLIYLFTFAILFF